MTATREASDSARSRLSASRPRERRPAQKRDQHGGEAEDDQAGAQRRPGIRSGASTAPATIAATDSASNTPMTRPRTSDGHDAGERRLGDHLARDEADAADQRHDQRDGEDVDPRVGELRRAEQRARADDDARDPRAGRRAEH